MSASTTASTAAIVYRVFLACALAVGAVAAVFFAVGISDGSVSSFNIGIWIALLAGLSAVLAVALVLRSRGSTGGAIAVLSLVAVPGIVAVLFMLVVLVTQPRWN